MNTYEHIAKLLQTRPEIVEKIDTAMAAKLNTRGILERILKLNEEHSKRMLASFSGGRTQSNIHAVLRDLIINHERQVIDYVENSPGSNRFEKAVNIARQSANVGRGFFLKRELAKDILRKRSPDNLLKYLGVLNVEELFDKHDITEAFSALRFVESNEWMHKTFDEAYSNFKSQDFEEREIEIRALGDEWHEVAKKFHEKKRHNVSHLKEFGVIFLNPITDDGPGKFFRDFALLFHYLHEVNFYSKLFQNYADSQNFAGHLKSLLRGDILEAEETKDAEWLIVQRYLDKEDKNDPRLLLPRVNPEALHWARAEKDLTNLGKNEVSIDLEVWEDLDWVAYLCSDNEGIVSFDLEDNAMSLVAHHNGQEVFHTYHQREALWTRIFQEYVGGEENMEKLLVDHFTEGIIRF